MVFWGGISNENEIMVVVLKASFSEPMLISETLVVGFFGIFSCVIIYALIYDLVSGIFIFYDFVLKIFFYALYPLVSIEF